MGRLWQTLILSEWKELFTHVPVESLIRDHQAGYYAAVNASDQAGNSTAFITFMLEIIHDALADLVASTPQVGPQVKQLLTALMDGPRGRASLQSALNLSDRKSFRERYLQPVLEAGLIAMTRPDTPNSRLQQYRLTTLGRRTIGAT